MTEPLVPPDPDTRRNHTLVHPDGYVADWLWGNHSWHGPVEKAAHYWTHMSAVHAAIEGYKLAEGHTSPPGPKPTEATCQDGTPPQTPVYRMRADGLTLEDYIKNRRERVLSMRRQADEQARLVRDQLERADMLETELDCLEASMMRANSEDLT